MQRILAVTFHLEDSNNGGKIFDDPPINLRYNQTLQINQYLFLYFISVSKSGGDFGISLHKTKKIMSFI